jgi:hypothetical protein
MCCGRGDMNVMVWCLLMIINISTTRNLSHSQRESLLTLFTSVNFIIGDPNGTKRITWFRFFNSLLIGIGLNKQKGISYYQSVNSISTVAWINPHWKFHIACLFRIFFFEKYFFIKKVLWIKKTVCFLVNWGVCSCGCGQCEDVNVNVGAS